MLYKYMTWSQWQRLYLSIGQIIFSLRLALKKITFYPILRGKQMIVKFPHGEAITTMALLRTMYCNHIDWHFSTRNQLTIGNQFLLSSSVLWELFNVRNNNFCFFFLSFLISFNLLFFSKLLCGLIFIVMIKYLTNKK